MYKVDASRRAEKCRSLRAQVELWQCACVLASLGTRARVCQWASVDVYRQKSSATAWLASCSVSMCECAARMCGGSQAHPLPSCAPVVARLAVHARSHSMAPNERSRARTMANTPLARRMRDESGSPCPNPVIQHAFGRQKSPAWTSPLQPAGWVEGHLGAARFLCMTCIEWVVEPAAAMTWRIR